MNQGMDDPAPRQNRHLSTRCGQRGVTKRELHTLLDAADHLVPVGRSCVAMTLSRRAAEALQAEGIAAAGLERARRRTVIIDGDGTPITVLVPTRRHGRRYRRGQTGRSWA